MAENFYAGFDFSSTGSLGNTFFDLEMANDLTETVRDSRLSLNNVTNTFQMQLNQQQPQHFQAANSSPPLLTNKLVSQEICNSHRVSSASPQGNSRRPMVDYCTFCYKTNPEHALTHRLKDELDRVTCLVLLNNKCTFCHNLGHTPKNCPEVKKRNKKRQIKHHLMSLKQESNMSSS